MLGRNANTKKNSYRGFHLVTKDSFKKLNLLAEEQEFLSLCLKVVFY